MTCYRIPPSLKWLTTRRARLAGTLEKAEKAKEILLVAQVKQLSALDGQIATIKQDLEAIDRALSLHEISIDPKRIRSIREHEKGRCTSYGGMTREVFRCLSQLKGKPASTREIAVTVATSLGVDLASPEFVDLRERIRYRLKDLVAAKRIRRIHNAKCCVEGWWALP